MRSRMGLQKSELQEMLLNHQTSHSQVTKPRDCIKPQRSRQAPKSKRGSEQSWQTPRSSRIISTEKESGCTPRPRLHVPLWSFRF
ncbi:hypothetical protein NC652_025343 [Populus alba x Populus x berolinensis]|nr:hypothetical protein NC652_025343 [Populus alba x Populus x berolinensis]